MLLDLQKISQEAGHMVWYSHLFKNFPIVCCDPQCQRLYHTQWRKSRCILEFPCFLYNPMNVGIFTSGFSAFSKHRLYVWKFLVCVLLKPSLKDFEHYFASIWKGCNFTIVKTFLGIVLLWDWNGNWHFPVLWPLLSFPNLLIYWVQHLNSTVF